MRENGGEDFGMWENGKMNVSRENKQSQGSEVKTKRKAEDDGKTLLRSVWGCIVTETMEAVLSPAGNAATVIHKGGSTDLSKEMIPSEGVAWSFSKYHLIVF